MFISEKYLSWEDRNEAIKDVKDKLSKTVEDLSQKKQRQKEAADRMVLGKKGSKKKAQIENRIKDRVADAKVKALEDIKDIKVEYLKNRDHKP